MRGPSSKNKGAVGKGRSGKQRREAPTRDDADIFIDEVNEELQREQLTRLALTYGPYVAGVVVATLIGAFGFEFFRSQAIEARRDTGSEIIRAMNEQAPATEFERIAGAVDGGAAVLAQFRAAAALSDGQGEDDDKARAAEIYASLYGRADIEAAYADLARVRSAQLRADDADPGELVALLAPAAAETRPYRPLALELTAAAHLRAGERDEARKALQLALADPRATRASRSRVQALIAALEDEAPATEADPTDEAATDPARDDASSASDG